MKTLKEKIIEILVNSILKDKYWADSDFDKLADQILSLLKDKSQEEILVSGYASSEPYEDKPIDCLHIGKGFCPYCHKVTPEYPPKYPQQKSWEEKMRLVAYGGNVHSEIADEFILITKDVLSDQKQELLDCLPKEIKVRRRKKDEGKTGLDFLIEGENLCRQQFLENIEK